MKKKFVLFIALTFILSAANLSFAANEFRMKGIVIKINGSQITIRDDKSKEMTVEGNMSEIKVGDPVLLKGQIFKKTRTELTTQDIEFLTKQCLIDRTDVNVIPQLEEQTQMRLVLLIDQKDCKKLIPFKNSRNYYRQLKPTEPIPFPPAGWNGNYLTNDELLRYSDILTKAPW